MRKEIQYPNLGEEFYFQWHLTERCNLKCKHCYQTDNSIPELSLDSLSLYCNVTVITDKPELAYDFKEYGVNIHKDSELILEIPADLPFDSAKIILNHFENPSTGREICRDDYSSYIQNNEELLFSAMSQSK